MAIPKPSFNPLFSIGTVDPTSHIILLGPTPITDWQNFKLSMVDSERVVAIKGANGRTDRKIKGNADWYAEFTLQHSSPINHILALNYSLDVGIINQGPIPFIIADLNGSTLFASIGAWVQGFADYSVGSSGAQGRRWRIYCVGFPNDMGISFL